MAPEPGPAADALAPLPPGPLLRIARGRLAVDIAPAAGGRLAGIACDGVEQLVGAGQVGAAAIAWGCYPMLPWAGRTRHGRFAFGGRRYALPCNLGGHAIHGVGFTMPWRTDAHAPAHVELSLDLPEDARWPFGGSARQRIEVGGDWLRLELSVAAGARAMPVALGWHPWFRKPERMTFSPEGIYPRDADGIATRALAPVPPGPWDDCFLNRAPVLLHRAGRTLTLSSDCVHWVVYDVPAHATCIEPQSAPPDALNGDAQILEPGESRSIRYLMAWR